MKFCKTCDNCAWLAPGYYNGVWLCANEFLMVDGEYGDPYEINEEVDCEYWAKRED